VPDQLGIFIQVRSVAALMPRRQRNGVERIQVPGSKLA
jgi:hypothetical protein